ncbi:hypothetical protein Tco_0664453 [Tanacetum coccineum]
MTKVIKGEFEKLEDLMVKDVSLTCDTSLEVFNIEFNRISGMDDCLFAYEVEVVNILCESNKDDDSEQRVSHEGDDDMGYDPSDVAFTKWLGSEIFNYKTMDHYTKKALWIYGLRDDEVLSHDEVIFCNEVELLKTYLLRTLRDSRLMKNIRMIGSMNGTKIYHGLMRNHGLTLEFRLNPHYYQDYEWYEALKDSELKEQALRNKAIMEGLINYENETHDERQELCETHELPVCNIRRFEMIKYLFGQDEEYVAVKEDEYDDLARTSDNACRAYQEIFRMMDGPRERNIDEYWWRIYKSGDLEVLES